MILRSRHIALLGLLIVLGCFGSQAVSAQKNHKPVIKRDSTGTTKAQRDWNKMMTFADNVFRKNLDSTYLTLPKYRWRVAINGEAGGVYTFLVAHDVPYYGELNTYFRSNVTPKIGLQLSFRNFNVGYAVDLYKGYSNFSLALMQNAFGIELLRRKTFYAAGYMDASNIEGRKNVEPGDIGITTLFLSMYYAFNHRKFSMPASYKQSFIQRKSAGSVLAYMDFRYSDLNFEKESYMVQAGGMKELELYQLCLGVGYGYNYTPNQGKFLLNVTVVPMITFFNQMLMTGDSRMFWHNDDDDYNLVFSRKIKGRYPVFFTGMARLALVWNINDRFMLALTGVCNNIRYRMRDKMFEIDREDLDLYYNTVLNAYIMTWDWKANLFLGVRF